MIFSVDESDATRAAVCGKGQPEGICRVETHDQLVTMARATAATTARVSALGVVLTK